MQCVDFASWFEQAKCKRYFWDKYGGGEGGNYTQTGYWIVLWSYYFINFVGCNNGIVVMFKGKKSLPVKFEKYV